MADQKISARTAVVTPTSADVFPVVQAGVDKRMTLAQVSDYLATDLAGKETRFIPANVMVPRTTAGAQATTREINSITIPVVRFDAAADEGVNIPFAFPKGWGAGTIVVQAYWTATGGGAAQTVQFEIRGGCFADSAAIDATGLGTAVAITDTWLADDDVHISAESGPITLSNAADDTLCVLEIIRDVSDDDLAGDADLIGIELIYTATTINDD